jgi:hypothetical protein
MGIDTLFWPLKEGIEITQPIESSKQQLEIAGASCDDEDGFR